MDDTLSLNPRVSLDPGARISRTDLSSIRTKAGPRRNRDRASRRAGPSGEIVRRAHATAWPARVGIGSTSDALSRLRKTLDS
jgi:hypothetical protein